MLLFKQKLAFITNHGFTSHVRKLSKPSKNPSPKMRLHGFLPVTGMA